jgi:intermembrane space import and assembly protein 40
MITHESRAKSSDTPSASSSDASESHIDRIDKKDDEALSEEEEEVSPGGAFDPVTGKINWDCPCLGGMAHGPCGMQFREAFSCFVFSEEEPKGIDCVEKFKAMQDCFRENPDVYGEGTHHSLNPTTYILSQRFRTEIMNDDDDDEEQTTAPPNAGDTVPAPPAGEPAESIPSR